MYVSQVLISLTLAYSLPIEDTEEVFWLNGKKKVLDVIVFHKKVAAAKAEFAELFSAAEVFLSWQKITDKKTSPDKGADKINDKNFSW